MTIKSCDCFDWINTVENRNARQRNGALSVGFMMDDPVRPYMQYEAAGEISFCPWCGQYLLNLDEMVAKKAKLWQAIDWATSRERPVTSRFNEPPRNKAYGKKEEE